MKTFCGRNRGGIHSVRCTNTHTRIALPFVAAVFSCASLLSGCATREVVDPPAELISKTSNISLFKNTSLCLVVGPVMYKFDGGFGGIFDAYRPLREAMPRKDALTALTDTLKENFKSVERVDNVLQTQGKGCDLVATVDVEWYTKGELDEYDIYKLNLALTDPEQGLIDTLKVQGKSMGFQDFGYGHHGGDTFSKARERTMKFLMIALNNSEPLAAFVARATQTNDARFQNEAAHYLALNPKPTLPEEVRGFRIQAELAVNEKRFSDALERYQRALDIAPWWPAGHFNVAIIHGELKQYNDAIHEMKRYLMLVPNATDARAAQDRIYEWESKAGKLN